jgi:hypothetical protein
MLRPYVSAGPVFALVRIDERNSNYSDYDNTPDLIVDEQRYSGGVALGLRGALGLDVRLTQTVGVFSEVAFVSMTYHHKGKETLKYEVNGQDEVPSWSVSQREVEYLASTNLNTAVSDFSPEAPSKELRTYFGMGSLTVAVGLKVTL